MAYYIGIYLVFGILIGVLTGWVEPTQAIRRLPAWVVGLIVISWPLCAAIFVCHFVPVLVGGIVKLLSGSYRHEINACLKTDTKCRVCGAGPLIFSARAIGDNLCHYCGHKAFAELSRQVKESK